MDAEALMDHQQLEAITPLGLKASEERAQQGLGCGKGATHRSCHYRWMQPKPLWKSGLLLGLSLPKANHNQEREVTCGIQSLEVDLLGQGCM